MFCFNEGLVSIFFIFVLLFYILIENRIKHKRYWEITYVLFMLNFLAKLLLGKIYSLESFNDPINANLKYHYPSENLAKLIMFFYGNNYYNYSLCIFVFLEIVLMVISTNLNYDKTFAEIENPS